MFSPGTPWELPGSKEVKWKERKEKMRDGRRVGGWKEGHRREREKSRSWVFACTQVTMNVHRTNWLMEGKANKQPYK